MTASGPAAVPLSPADERLWGGLAQFGNIVGPLPSLLILLVLGPRSPFVKDAAREALNFSITALLGWVALQVLQRICDAVYSALPAGVDLVFGLLVLLLGLAQFALWVLVVVLSIVAGVRVNRGGTVRYPFALRLVR